VPLAQCDELHHDVEAEAEADGEPVSEGHLCTLLASCLRGESTLDPPRLHVRVVVLTVGLPPLVQCVTLVRLLLGVSEGLRAVLPPLRVRTSMEGSSAPAAARLLFSRLARRGILPYLPLHYLFGYGLLHHFWSPTLFISAFSLS